MADRNRDPHTPPAGRGRCRRTPRPGGGDATRRGSIAAGRPDRPGRNHRERRFLTAGSASKPSAYVPARYGGWPHWLAGPFEGLDVGISAGSFQAFMLLMCASYLAVLLLARRLPMGAIAAAIVCTHAVLLLGPPLISQDVFGYLDFARLGALHGLDPYTHVAADAPTDPAFRVRRLVLRALSIRPAVHAGELRRRAARSRGGPVGAERCRRRGEPGGHRAGDGCSGQARPLAALGGGVRRPEPRPPGYGRGRGAQRHARDDAARGCGAAGRRRQSAATLGLRGDGGGSGHQGDRRARAAVHHPRRQGHARAPEARRCGGSLPDRHRGDRADRFRRPRAGLSERHLRAAADGGDSQHPR